MNASTFARVLFFLTLAGTALGAPPAAAPAPAGAPPVGSPAPEPNPYDDLDHEQPPPDTAEPPAPRGGQIERRKVQLRDGMLRIPGGEFTMGFDEGSAGEPNEKPAHVVRVQAFWLDRTEVTVGAMRECRAKGACSGPLGKGATCTIGRPEADLPVNCVPWHAADAYCRAVGKRLPTEAEWEFAAGGGLKIRFPWGSAAPSCGIGITLQNNRAGTSCSPQGPLAVGKRPKGASVFGVEDMAGNVEEWVADWYADRYEVQLSRRTPVPSPTGPAFGVAHVLRGGSWMSRPRDARVTFRNWGSPNEQGPNVGFRCAQD